MLEKPEWEHDWMQFGTCRWITALLWLATVIALAAWHHDDVRPLGWDLNIYTAAAVSLQHQHDPYTDAMAVQEEYHRHEPHPFGSRVPYSYVYSPTTLPLARPLAGPHAKLALDIYWMFYALSALVPLALGMWMARDEREACLFAIFAPLTLFFAAMIQNIVIFCGNIAYILHGLVLLAAWRGWTRRRWGWFYAAVLLASCFKAPMLYLLAIPVLSERRQWWQAASAAVAGIALFASQAVLYPTLFPHYLKAVNLQFLYNHDFSASPVGLLAEGLYSQIPYQWTTAIFYPLFSALFVWMLFILRKKYLRGELELKEWIPLMLVGVELLNIRIMEYDIAAITLMMAIVTWRSLSRFVASPRIVAWTMAGLVVALQMFGQHHWREEACLTLVAVFGLGFWSVGRPARSRERKTVETMIA